MIGMDGAKSIKRPRAGNVRFLHTVVLKMVIEKIDWD